MCKSIQYQRSEESVSYNLAHPSLTCEEGDLNNLSLLPTIICRGFLAHDVMNVIQALLLNTAVYSRQQEAKYDPLVKVRFEAIPTWLLRSHIYKTSSQVLNIILVWPPYSYLDATFWLFPFYFITFFLFRTSYLMWLRKSGSWLGFPK